MKHLREQNIKKNIQDLLLNIEIPICDEVKKNTPLRVAQFFEEALSGYLDDPHMHGKVFTIPKKTGLIVLKDIAFSSLCQHHLLPFFGNITIGYVPNNKILGLSKFVRIVEVFSKRLQLQEHLTTQIMHAINDVIEPLGVAVHINARHLCMVSRGVKNSQSSLITSEFSGVLKTKSPLKHEFLMMLQIQKQL